MWKTLFMNVNKSFYCKGNTRDKTEKPSIKNKDYFRLTLRCKEAQDQLIKCQTHEMDGRLGLSWRSSLLKALPRAWLHIWRPWWICQGRLDTPARLAPSAFFQDGKVGRFWAKNNCLHSHFRPLTETFKLKRENGSQSNIENLSFTTPGGLLEWQ